MSDLNRSQIIGRLGKNPEGRSTAGGGRMASFTVATSEEWTDRSSGQLQQRTEWHRCIAFGKTASAIERMLRKGSLVYVEGPMQTRSWDDKDGIRRHITEIKVMNVRFLSNYGTRADGPSSGSVSPGSAPPESAHKTQQDGDPAPDSYEGPDFDDPRF